MHARLFTLPSSLIVAEEDALRTAVFAMIASTLARLNYTLVSSVGCDADVNFWPLTFFLFWRHPLQAADARLRRGPSRDGWPFAGGMEAQRLRALRSKLVNSLLRTDERLYRIACVCRPRRGHGGDSNEEMVGEVETA